MADTLRIGVAGLGTVGVALIRLLRENQAELKVTTGRDIVVSAVSARSKEKDRGIDLSDCEWFSDPVELAKSDKVDVFVELIGGEDGAAKQSVEAALGAKKSVVTANKALLAYHGVSLAHLAEENIVSLNYEAAVAGGIPIIKIMREALSGNKVSRAFGIMNGTCNYILTRMEAEKISFEDCLSEAQRLGYAEADPTFDIGGHDTAHKLAILTSLAFGTKVSLDGIYLEGIEQITLSDIEAADELGYRIKLLGVAQRTDSGIEQRVHPTMVPKSSAIAQIDGVTNAVGVEADRVGSLMFSGPGAGGDATASAVAGDIADLARGAKVSTFARKAEALAPYERARMRAHKGGYYLSLNLSDRPGMLASVATHMADAGISLQSVVQNRNTIDAGENRSEDAQPVVIITHDTTEEAMRDAVARIVADGHVSGKPKMIRIET